MIKVLPFNVNLKIERDYFILGQYNFLKGNYFKDFKEIQSVFRTFEYFQI